MQTTEKVRRNSGWTWETATSSDAKYCGAGGSCHCQPNFGCNTTCRTSEGSVMSDTEAFHLLSMIPAGSVVFNMNFLLALLPQIPEDLICTIKSQSNKFNVYQ